MYKLLRPILFLIDAETMHNFTLAAMARLSHPWAENMFAAVYNYEHPMLHTTVFGVHFKNPVGLAAGFDKNGLAINFLDSLGFGYIEVGTVTPEAQEGNLKPRVFRLPRDSALVNRLGFNNRGMGFLAERLKRRRNKGVVGVNIGKNKDTPNEKAVQDYEKCFTVLCDHADYIVLNVSSPNTPHLRELQDKEPLTALLKRIQELNRAKDEEKPVLLKIAPDLAYEQLDDIVEIIKETGVAGIIASNTTLSREGLTTPPNKVDTIGNGGLSGKPLTSRSTEIIRYLFKKSHGGFPIVGAGGIFSAEDAYHKIRAGASLVQLYTGLVYEGPSLVRRIKQGLVRLLERDGFSSIGQARGTLPN